MYHYYYIYIITVTLCCIYDGNIREGLHLGTVNASHCYGGTKKGPLDRDLVFLQLLVGDGHYPRVDDDGLGLNVHGSR